MSTFKAYFKKEIIEAIRTYRYIIIAAVLIFFAISDPILLKLLPSILKSQTQMDISSFLVINEKMALQNYIKDLFQLCNIVIVLVISGTLGKEIKDGKLIFPYSKGSSPAGIVLAKAVHYVIYVGIITFLGFLINYYYVTMLFKNDGITIIQVLISAASLILFFVFNILLTMVFSCLIKKDIAAGIIVLFLCYFSITLKSVKGIYDFLPMKLIDTANSFSSVGMAKPTITVIVACIALIAIMIYQMSKVEVV
ncbi:MAG TPA: hypothetical protein VIK72_18410 [Clostridiaceae bacterium]